MPYVKEFTETGDFAALDAARRWLTDHGYSYGELQRGAPCAIWKGDCLISKWRGLSEEERANCHGTMTAPGMFGDGPVTVTLRDEFAPTADKTRKNPKQSLYIPLDLLATLQAEAKRLDRSLSWVVRFALTRGGIESLKAMPDAV